MRGWMVYNEAKNEGIFLTDKDDAVYASTGEIRGSGFGVSTLAEEFRELYAEDLDAGENLPMEEVEVTPA